MGTSTRELSPEGLDCASCADKIEQKIKQLEGITDVSVNFATQKLTLEITDMVLDLDRVLNEVKGVIKKLEPDVVVREED